MRGPNYAALDEAEKMRMMGKQRVSLERAIGTSEKEMNGGGCFNEQLNKAGNVVQGRCRQRKKL